MAANPSTAGGQPGTGTHLYQPVWFDDQWRVEHAHHHQLATRTGGAGAGLADWHAAGAGRGRIPRGGKRQQYGVSVFADDFTAIVDAGGRDGVWYWRCAGVLSADLCRRLAHYAEHGGRRADRKSVV